jgi:hypothetical protein
MLVLNVYISSVFLILFFSSIDFAKNPDLRPDISKVKGRSVLRKMLDQLWSHDPQKRGSFSEVQDKLTKILEGVTVYVLEKGSQSRDEAVDFNMNAWNVQELKQRLEERFKRRVHKCFVEGTEITRDSQVHELDEDNEILVEWQDKNDGEGDSSKNLVEESNSEDSEEQ